MNNTQSITIGVMLRHIDEKGGITVYTKNMLDNILQADQQNQYVLFFSSSSCLGNYEKYPNVQEALIPSKKTLLGRLLWDQYLLLKYIKKYNVDVVFNPKLSVPLFTKCKTIFTMHGLEQFAASRLFIWYDKLYFKIAMRLYCRKANGILCMTKAGETDLQRYLNVPEGKIHVIPESYNEQCEVINDKAGLERIRDKFYLPRKFLLFVGGITPLKNISALLRAFRSLKSKGYEHN